MRDCPLKAFLVIKGFKNVSFCRCLTQTIENGITKPEFGIGQLFACLSRRSVLKGHRK